MTLERMELLGTFQFHFHIIRIEVRQEFNFHFNNQMSEGGR
jgi:hypothetical protein